MEPRPSASSSSSSLRSISNKELLTTEELVPSEMELDAQWQAIDSSPLAELRFGRSQIAQIAQSGRVTVEQLQESIYAFAFDLTENQKSKNISGAPLNYFMGILRKGPYTPPVNYENPEDRQQRLYLEAKEQQRKLRLERESRLETVELLKGDDKHLSEDHLFTLCQLLEFSPEEVEYLMLLRAEIVSGNSSRRKYLKAKLSHLREEKKLKAAVKTHAAKDIDYLFEPLCVVVHVSLGIEEYRKNPHRLSSALGITRARLKEVLRRLRDLDFVEMDSSGVIAKVNEANFHFSPDHPLMRAHQNLLRTLSLSYLARTDEEDRLSFMVTFSADHKTFHGIRESFQKFMQETEKQVGSSRSQNTYQMNFDVFRWV